MRSFFGLSILPYYKDKPCMNLPLKLANPSIHLDAIVSELHIANVV